MNRVRWASYTSSSGKFAIVYMCQKLWKLVESRQSYCNENHVQLFGPPGTVFYCVYTEYSLLQKNKKLNRPKGRNCEFDIGA